MANTCDFINNQVNCKCVQGDNNRHLHNVSVIHVLKAINKIKKGQFDHATALYSESILNGTQKLFTYLSFLYTIMLKHGFSCEAFNDVVIKPIVKDKRKPNNDSDNHRAIAPKSTLAKLLDYIIIDVFQDILETSDYQFAYKSSFSTTLCSFMVVETIQYYRSKGNNVFVSLLDFSKAFDLVRYDKLFKLLLDRNLCPLVIRLLLNIYMNSMYSVCWNGITSDKFSISNGVKQGGVLSSLLFTIYMEPLISKTKLTKLGCHIGNKFAAMFICR